MAHAIRENAQQTDEGGQDQIDVLIGTFGDSDHRSDHAADEIAFEELYRYYKPSLVRYANRKQAIDPDGVANLALFDGYQALGSMRRPNRYTFRSYLFQAVRTHVIKEHRRANPSPTAVDDEKIRPSVGFESELVGTISFHEMVDQLPVDQRQVIRYRFLHGLTAKETGHLLGKDPNAVYQLQHRAVRRLHRLILAGVALAVAVGAVVVLTRQSERQIIDSSPARSIAVVEGDVGPTTTVNQVVADTERSSAEQAEDTQPSEDPQPEEPADSAEVKNATQNQDGSAASEPIVDAAPTTQVQATSPPATADDSSPLTTTIPPAPGPAGSAATTGPQEPLDGVIGSEVVVIADDDVVTATLGESVAFNVLLNDGPTSNLGTVTLMSGRAEGLTLGADGMLTGSPTATGSFTLVYRLTGLNGNTDFGRVLVTVS